VEYCIARTLQNWHIVGFCSLTLYQILFLKKLSFYYATDCGFILFFFLGSCWKTLRVTFLDYQPCLKHWNLFYSIVSESFFKYFWKRILCQFEFSYSLIIKTHGSPSLLNNITQYLQHVIGFGRPTADASEHNGHPSCTKCLEYTDQLSDRQLPKNSSNEISSLFDTEISCLSITMLTFEKSIQANELQFSSFYIRTTKANLGAS